MPKGIGYKTSKGKKKKAKRAASGKAGIPSGKGKQTKLGDLLKKPSRRKKK